MTSVSWRTWKTNREFGFFADHDSPHSFGVGGVLSTHHMAILVDGTAISFLVTPPAGGSPSNISVTTGLEPVNTLEFSTEIDVAGGPQLIEFRISESACSVKHAPRATCPLQPASA
jgi:hypothetical protein